jgi:hypothetical protein
MPCHLTLQAAFQLYRQERKENPESPDRYGHFGFLGLLRSVAAWSGELAQGTRGRLGGVAISVVVVAVFVASFIATVDLGKNHKVLLLIVAALVTLVVGGLAEEVLRRKPWRWVLNLVATMYSNRPVGTYSVQYLVPESEAFRARHALQEAGFSDVRASRSEATDEAGQARIAATMLPGSGTDMAGGQRLVEATLDELGVTHRWMGGSGS